MQTKEAPKLRKARPSETRSVDRFCARLGADPRTCYRNLYVLEVPGGSYYDLFDVPPTVEDVLVRKLGGRVYSAGYYIGLLDLATLVFKPGLPLAHRLAPYCGGIKCCVIHEDTAILAFTKGKQVRTGIPRECSRWRGEVVLVVNELGEALGWGRIEGQPTKEPGKPLKRPIRYVLTPVVDLGWYLRRGG